MESPTAQLFIASPFLECYPSQRTANTNNTHLPHFILISSTQYLVHFFFLFYKYLTSILRVTNLLECQTKVETILVDSSVISGFQRLNFEYSQC